MDNPFMMRCLYMAKQALGMTAPNPMVGCVIVNNGEIIGEGFHEKFGGTHAEVNAIQSVKNKGILHQSSLYVNLEPCSHFGKTPPCADLIIEKKIPRVVIGASDPNPLVNGKGVEKLRASGIEVNVDILEKECRELNKRFYNFYDTNKPYIILKWAQSQDGFIAPESGERTQLSDWYSQKLAHKWRGEEMAVLVGFNTALHDDPELNVRFWHGKNPVRLVIDKNISLPDRLHLFDKSVRTVIFTEKKKTSEAESEFVHIDYNNFPQQIAEWCFANQIQSVIIEGGTVTLNQFIKNDCWNEARVFITPKILKSGITAPQILQRHASNEQLLNDHLFIYRNQNVFS